MKSILRSYSLALTLAAALFAAQFVAPASWATDLPEAPVMLNAQVTVSSDMVALGDLFANAGDAANRPVAYAPQPGKKAVFDARWLARVAKAYKLDWRPLGTRDRAIVERASSIISRTDIEDTLQAVLVSDFGAEVGLNIELSNSSLRLHVPVEAEATVAVNDVKFDARTGRFSAYVSAPAHDPNAARSRVTGNLISMTEIPVLTRRMMSGEVIGEGDIEWVKTRTARLQGDVISDAGQLIGLAAKRGLRAGQPIRTAEVRTPRLISKGQIVTLVVKTPAMTLTSQGRALDEGGRGDVIRIINTQSRTTVEGTINRTGVVTVRPASHLVMN